MAESYTEYHFKIEPVNPGAEILIAQLADFDFESFDETEDGVKAYIQSALDHDQILESVTILQNPEFESSYTKSLIEPVN